MPVKARLTGLLMALCCGALLVGGLAGAQGRSYQPRVVGGTAAPADGRFDAVARILIDRTTQCTGTLVAPRYVLTAAHCVYRPKVLGVPLAPAPSVKVTLGTTRSDGAGGTAYDVDAISIPPEYDDNDHHDVALLRLTTTASQAPVKVAGVGAQPLWAPGVLETVAGFGATSEGGSSASEMQVAQVPIIDDATCRTRYGTFENATQICAGYPQGGIDTCQGDSGGPLFGSDANGAFKLVGATSYGDGCARPGSPGVYARVADTTLREWIRSIAPAAIDDAVALPGRTTSGTTSTGTTTATGTQSSPPEQQTTTAAPPTTTSSASSPPAAQPAQSPAPAAPAGPSQPTTASPTAGGGAQTLLPTFRTSFAVDRVRRQTLRRRGVRVRMRCSSACTVKLRFVIDARTRKALRLRARTLRLVTTRLSAGRRRAVRLRLPSRYGARLMSRRRVKFSVSVRLTPVKGTGRSYTRTRTLRVSTR